VRLYGQKRGTIELLLQVLNVRVVPVDRAIMRVRRGLPISEGAVNLRVAIDDKLHAGVAAEIIGFPASSPLSPLPQ
jgi:hypothetical protein